MSITQRCPLLMQGIMANPAVASFKPDTLDKLCGCMKSGCALWAEVEVEDERGAERLVEGCSLKLVQDTLVGVGESVSEVEEALGEIEEPIRAIAAVLNVVAAVAGKHLGIPEADLLVAKLQQQSAQASEDDGNENRDGDDDDDDDDEPSDEK